MIILIKIKLLKLIKILLNKICKNIIINWEILIHNKKYKWINNLNKIIK